MKRNVFFAKLCELSQDDRLLTQCLQRCQTQDPAELRAACRQARQAYDAANRRLENAVRNSRSPAVSALAEAQRAYYRRAEALAAQVLPGWLHSEASTCDEDRQEAQLLYAEYAIDFARQSLYYALCSALSAAENQLVRESDHDKQGGNAP